MQRNKCRFLDSHRQGPPQRRRQVVGARKHWGPSLVDEVADVGEDAFAEFDTEEAGVDPGLQGDFKALQDGGRQVGLLAEQLEQRLAVGSRSRRADHMRGEWSGRAEWFQRSTGSRWRVE